MKEQHIDITLETNEYDQSTFRFPLNKSIFKLEIALISIMRLMQDFDDPSNDCEFISFTSEDVGDAYLLVHALHRQFCLTGDQNPKSPREIIDFHGLSEHIKNPGEIG